MKNKFKKGILFAVVIIIVIICFILVRFGLENDDQAERKKLSTLNNLFENISSTPIPTYPQLNPIADNTLPVPPGGWVVGDNALYTIDFPPTWNPTVTSVGNGGTNVVIQPENSKYFPRINIESAPTDPNNPIEKRIKRLKGFIPFNYSEYNTSFRGVPVLQISEILPIGDMDRNPAHKTYLFFNRGDISYVVTYTYFQDKNAETNKVVLLQILNSIKFK